MPSTGKLYHHKMKLRNLKADTKNEEAIEYLRKRHPLYFLANKVSEEQINDLINRLKFKNLVCNTCRMELNIVFESILLFLIVVNQELYLRL